MSADPTLEATPARVVINIKGDPPAGTVSVVQAVRKDETPMLGEWTSDPRLVFTPRFPFEKGVKYRVVVGQFESTFTLAAEKAKPAVVEAIYPKAEKLPANVLRFYLHFDQPMKQGQGLQHFHMLEATGKEITEAFLELQEELWNAEGTRLTLYLNPGRVKKELEPRKTLGPVLMPEKQYILVVGKEFQTLDGQALSKVFRKSFSTFAAVEKGLDPANWKVNAMPKEVTIEFDVIMDHALLTRCIAVETIEGKAVAGKPVAGETTWHWRPEAPLPAGQYRLVIDSVLEDVCGNRIGAAFDSPLGELGVRGVKKPTKLPFEVK